MHVFGSDKNQELRIQEVNTKTFMNVIKKDNYEYIRASHNRPSVRVDGLEYTLTFKYNMPQS